MTALCFPTWSTILELHSINIKSITKIQHNLVSSFLHIKACNHLVIRKAVNTTLSFELSMELNFWVDLHLFLRLLFLLTPIQKFSPQRHQTASCLPDVQFFCLGLSCHTMHLTPMCSHDNRLPNSIVRLRHTCLTLMCSCGNHLPNTMVLPQHANFSLL